MEQVMSLKTRVGKTIHRYGMFSRGDRVGIALSGGPDSMALLHLLFGIAGDQGISLVILHMNHGMRGEESDSEEYFVRDTGGAMGIPVVSRFVSIPAVKKERGGSWEEVARDERYAFFEDMTREQGLNRIALGHTMNDQAETVLINLFRGSGPEGLKGIPPVRNIYVRPLIDISRDEVIEFLRREEISFVTDRSNRDEGFLRNRIRASLIPELQKSYNSSIVAGLTRMADIIREEDDFMKRRADEVMERNGFTFDGGVAEISAERFRVLHEAIQRRIVKIILEHFAPSNKGVGYSHVMAVLDAVRGDNPGAELILPFDIHLSREYDDIRVYSTREAARGEGPSAAGVEKSVKEFSYSLDIPGSVHIAEIGRTVKAGFINRRDIDFSSRLVAFLDYGSLCPPLHVRSVREGDRMVPLGMKGSKKVKDIFVDEKIPRRSRRAVPILVDGESILWVGGMKVSERAKITDVTEKVVKIEII